MRKALAFICLVASLAIAGCNSSPDVTSRITVDQAIASVCSTPSGAPRGNVSGSELQVHTRLRVLMVYEGYRYAESHAPAWRMLLDNPAGDPYGRMCAAYFLADTDPAARDLLEYAITSDNLRLRYNAAEAVRWYMDCDRTRTWAVNILIALLESDDLEGDSETDGDAAYDRVHAGTWPLGDQCDIDRTPIDDVCWDMGHMKEKRAVPALIRVLERLPKIPGAAYALGEIGDPRGAPILMKVLQDGTGYDGREITALGQLRYRPAVPILIDRLDRARPKPDSIDNGRVKMILEALKDIGDPSAIEPIENCLDADLPNATKGVARRVLAQLKSPDPVAALLQLLDQETYEPESADIIFDLHKSKDPRAIARFVTIAKTSPSAFLRREAIRALAATKTREALLQVAELLAVDFPRDLTAEWGWKIAPDFSTYFLELIQAQLKNATGQDFGRDRKKWIKWLSEVYSPDDGTRTTLP